jgi:dephospho-CoA kinase
LARPLTIGLTGAVAAGKSEALSAFEGAGAATISSDAIVHELLGTAEVSDALAERWGPEVVEDGEVDRTRVGEIVFADSAELGWLEGLLHPRVGARISDWLGSLPADTRFAVVEVPLLFEGGLADTFDVTVTVVAADEVRRERAGARGHALVPERESRQLSQEEKEARADHVLRNDGTVEELERQVSVLLGSLRG